LTLCVVYQYGAFCFLSAGGLRGSVDFGIDSAAMNAWRGKAHDKSRSSSLWRISIVCMMAALVVGPVVRWIDDRTRWTVLGFGVEGARAVVGALSGSLLTFIVFVFSILLLVVQLAGAQLSPRVISPIFESRLTKLTLGAFVFAYTYSLTALGRIDDHVPQLSVLLAVLASLIGTAAFLYLIQDVGTALRPGILLTSVADATSRAIDTHYPHSLSQAAGEPESFAPDSRVANATLAYRGRSGVLVAVDAAALLDIATRGDCTIELAPRIGEFIAAGDTLFRFHGRGAITAETEQLYRSVTIRPELTLVDNPLFGFSIIVDIALKALSPAINDPGTAVEAIDRLHHLLNLLGHRQLGSGILRDASGQVRLKYGVPQWEDFIALSIAEVRAFADASPQVRRRLREMLGLLVRTLPEPRAAVLRKEIESENRENDAEPQAAALPERHAVPAGI
jgi:uncharacterized membrane protein